MVGFDESLDRLLSSAGIVRLVFLLLAINMLRPDFLAEAVKWAVFFWASLWWLMAEWLSFSAFINKPKSGFPL